MWRWIYNADFGALNGLLMQLGLIKHYVAWLTLPNLAMPLVIVADVWHMLPFVALILQAALAGLPWNWMKLPRWTARTPSSVSGASGCHCCARPSWWPWLPAPWMPFVFQYRLRHHQWRTSQ